MAHGSFWGFRLNSGQQKGIYNFGKDIRTPPESNDIWVLF